METLAATILDGRKVAAEIREEVRVETERLRAETGVVPGLAVVLVGDDPASKVYVGMKERACEAAGLRSFPCHLPADTPEDEVVARIEAFNQDPNVHGILVQHPLPEGIDEDRVFGTIAPDKDVDGVSVHSFGRLMAGDTRWAACTAQGMIELLDRYGIPIEGKDAVVVGRSKIVGRPMALLLMHRHATVTICHSRTNDLAGHCRRAEILVAAVGRAELIRGDMIRPGAAVLDAGYNRVGGRKGDVGDVDFESASTVAGAITPVPGGVGPMTIAMLLRNTLRAAQSHG